MSKDPYPDYILQVSFTLSSFLLIYKKYFLNKLFRIGWHPKIRAVWYQLDNVNPGSISEYCYAFLAPATGLNYYVGPCETSIEGDYDELMEIVKNCQLVAAKAGCPAMNTYVKISFKPEGDVLTIDKKVTKHHQ